MTDESVLISITIKLEDVVMDIQEKVPMDGVEESIHSLATGLGQQMLHGVIQVLDDRIARNMPAGWRNVGTEMRWMVSSLGAVRYQRRVYQDEQRRRRKPIDELFGLSPYGRMSGRVREMGASLASKWDLSLGCRPTQLPDQDRHQSQCLAADGLVGWQPHCGWGRSRTQVRV